MSEPGSHPSFRARLLPRPAAILFDWDDTLSHHRDISKQLMLQVYKNRGGKDENITGENLLKAWYDSPVKCCKRYFPDSSLAPDLLVQRMADEYRQKLNTLPVEDTKLLPGARELLENLAKKGVPLAIVSNKSQKRLEEELTFTQVKGFFKVIIGHETENKKKPHPDPILRALKHLGLPLENIWFVGDAPEDAEAARSDSIQRFHIGDFLRDIVHTRAEHNDPGGKIIFLKNIEEFRKYTDKMPEPSLPEPSLCPPSNSTTSLPRL